MLLLCSCLGPTEVPKMPKDTYCVKCLTDQTDIKKTVNSITLIKCKNITQTPNITVRQNLQPL